MNWEDNTQYVYSVKRPEEVATTIAKAIASHPLDIFGGAWRVKRDGSYRPLDGAMFLWFVDRFVEDSSKGFVLPEEKNGSGRQKLVWDPETAGWLRSKKRMVDLVKIALSLVLDDLAEAAAKAHLAAEELSARSSVDWDSDE